MYGARRCVWREGGSLSSSHRAEKGEAFWLGRRDLLNWQGLWVLMKFVLRSNTPAQQPSISPSNVQEAILEGTGLWAWPLPLCQLLIKINCPRSYPGHSTWSPGSCGDLVQNQRVIMEHTVKTDTHTWHGNQQPYKDKLETTVSCQPPH